jgi:hypothetical protein
MTTAPSVAVVATDVAHADRRALSEAWYATLHLAHDDGAARTNRARTTTTPARAVGRAGFAATAHHGAPTSATASRARSATAAAPPPALAERRSTSETARRVERALTRLAHAPGPPAAQTIALDGRRVRLLVRTDERATRIVAVCSEALRPAVERALAHARFALAVRR